MEYKYHHVEYLPWVRVCSVTRQGVCFSLEWGWGFSVWLWRAPISWGFIIFRHVYLHCLLTGSQDSSLQTKMYWGGFAVLPPLKLNCPIAVEVTLSSRLDKPLFGWHEPAWQMVLREKWGGDDRPQAGKQWKPQEGEAMRRWSQWEDHKSVLYEVWTWHVS